MIRADVMKVFDKIHATKLSMEASMSQLKDSGCRTTDQLRGDVDQSKQLDYEI